jgi:hypothetical protein
MLDFLSIWLYNYGVVVEIDSFILYHGDLNYV